MKDTEEKVMLKSIAKGKTKNLSIVSVLTKEIKKTEFYVGYNEETFYPDGFEVFEKLKDSGCIGKEVTITCYYEPYGTTIRKRLKDITYDGKSLLA